MGGREGRGGRKGWRETETGERIRGTDKEKDGSRRTDEKKPGKRTGRKEKRKKKEAVGWEHRWEYLGAFEIRAERCTLWVPRCASMRLPFSSPLCWRMRQL